MEPTSGILEIVLKAGAFGLVCLIVYRDLPAFRKSLEDAIAAFREELKAERERSDKLAAQDSDARHAQAGAVQSLGLQVQHLADSMEGNRGDAEARRGIEPR